MPIGMTSQDARDPIGTKGTSVAERLKVVSNAVNPPATQGVETVQCSESFQYVERLLQIWPTAWRFQKPQLPQGDHWGQKKLHIVWKTQLQVRMNRHRLLEGFDRRIIFV